MNIHRGRLFSFLTVSTLLLCSSPAALASDDNDAREVRISFVQGDVRLSRGDGKRTDLNKPWEQAQGGELLERGFAVATGDGRAEIEFENGSTVYLAENSLLLFTELSAPRERIVTRMTLPTGTATFSLQPVAGESFFIETPTDKLTIASPDAFFARVDAYLDSTAINPQGEKGESVVLSGLPKLLIPKGLTVYFQGGEIVKLSEPVEAGFYGFYSDQNVWLSINPQELYATATALENYGFGFPSGLVLRRLPSIASGTPQRWPYQAVEKLAILATGHPQVTGDWDNWVSSRVHESTTITTAALKASGLSTPLPGLNNLYRNGSFFQCAPYGTCWEPTQQAAEQAPSPQTSRPDTQSPVQNAPNTGFQPRTVEWQAGIWGQCDYYTSRRISRVAHSQQELEELLRQKNAAERMTLQGNAFSTSCWNGVWIHHHGHYARVLSVPAHPGCKLGSHCKPVHPPHPLFVRAGGKVGLVPRHPNDVKGKPPINLKNGIILSAKPGESLQHVAVDPSQRVKIFDKAPKEFQRDFVIHSVPVSAPQIRAHLMQEATHSQSTIVANHADSHIVYDYKSQKFMMPATAVAGAKPREVPVGGIASNGRVASFADGHSGRYADSFGHTSAAASYNGGGRGSGSYSSGSSYSGGGGYSGSHSSSSGSSGGSSSHSSGGGGGGSSSGSSSSSSSSSSGGGSRGRP
jgi:hypothetical protein